MYAIAKKTGISDSSLSRFMARKQGLSLDAVDKLAKLFGLSLTVVDDIDIGPPWRGMPGRVVAR